MSNQEQCPNCGGYRTESTVTYIDSQTGKKVSSPTCGLLLFLFMIAWVAWQGIVSLPSDVVSPLLVGLIIIVLFLVYKIYLTVPLKTI